MCSSTRFSGAVSIFSILVTVANELARSTYSPAYWYIPLTITVLALWILLITGSITLLLSNIFTVMEDV